MENEGDNMAAPRTEPYIWTTWLTKLLVGEDSCEWASWFKAHNKTYDRVPSTFDQATWQMQHTALLADTRDKLEAGGYAVFTERQNAFRLRGRTGITLGGRPDLIATLGRRGIILDAKTGQPRTSDHVQVMIYMWATSLALHQYKGMIFEGKVVYEDHEVPIPATAIDEPFKRNLTELIKRVGGNSPLRKVPSTTECEYCPISATECPERIKEGSQGGQPEPELADF